MKSFLRVLAMFSSLGLVLAFLPLSLAGQQEVEEASAAFNRWVAEASEFAGSVRFNEDDVRSFIQYWGELEEIGQEEDDDEEMLDFDAILRSSDYQSWASERGLDPEDWMRKSMRITLMIMGEQFRAQMAEARSRTESQVPEQLKMLEKQRAQMGEEMYQQMKQALEASAAMMSSLQSASTDWPRPTASENALLDKYRAQLLALMEAEDEEGDEPW